MIIIALLKEVPPFSTSAGVTVGEALLAGVFLGGEQAPKRIIITNKRLIVFIKYVLRERELSPGKIDRSILS